MDSSIKLDVKLYQRLMQYVLPYWRIFALSVACTMILAITNPAIPALMKPLLNGAFIEKDSNTIAMMPFLFAGLFIARAITSYVAITSLDWIANKVIMDIRVAMFARFINYPASYFDNNRIGNLMSRFTYDASQIKETSTKVIMILVRDLLSVIGLLAWMFYIDWLLALICLFGACIIGVFMVLIRQRLRDLGCLVQDSMGNINSVLNECFNGHKIIKLHNGKELEQQYFLTTANAHRKFSMKFLMIATAMSPVVQIIMAFVVALIIYLATKQAFINPLLVGDFVSFFAAIALLLGPLKQLASVNGHIQKGLAACNSTFSIIDKEVESQSGHKVLVHAEGKIRLQSVCYRYPGTKIDTVRSVSFEINPGEMIALVGESGSGKTTLANLIPRFYELQSGAICYDGIDIKKLSLASLRKNIAYVSQDIVLFNDSIRNNIAYGDLKDASDEAILAAAKAACAIEFINQLQDGLSTVIGDHGTRLSGGQRQRLAIARALLKDARLLIFDEATSSLDVHSEKQIQIGLENAKKDRACLVIAHRLSTIENADRIIVLHQGQIVEQGNHDTLLNLNNYYAKLYQIQFSKRT